MRYWIFCFIACSNAGCTVLAAERHTVAQADSAIDLRYREVMENLAQVCADPSTLPNFTSMYSGTIMLQDQGQLISTTTWPIKSVGMGAGSVVTNPSVNRQITQNWALDPTIVPEKLEAMRASLQWVVGGGPEFVNPDSWPLLVNPAKAPPGPDRHFDVEEQLNLLQPGWFGKGRHCDIPPGAHYQAHCGDCWVWVNPDGVRGLAEFTTIIEKIARVGINSMALYNLPPQYAPIILKTADFKPADRIQVTAQVNVDHSGSLYYFPFLRNRQDNAGQTADLRSIITAAAIPAPTLH